MSGRIIVERDEYVATILIDNPERRNALTRAMWGALADAVTTLSADQALRCIILRGGGGRDFCSGASIDEFEEVGATRDGAVRFSEQGHRAMCAVRDCPIPTVAAVRGACVGGGLLLAAACDVRISSDDGRFGIPISRLGAALAYPELQILFRIARAPVALELLLEGRVINAWEAHDRGMVARVVIPAQHDDEVNATVDRIVAGAPLPARWHKQFIARLRQEIRLTDDELAESYASFATEDFIEGFQSFLAKRRPAFKGN